MSERTRRRLWRDGLSGLATAAILAVGARGHEAAAAPASATVDLDGDGAAETISGDEVLVISGRTVKATVQLPGKAQLATLTAARVGSDKQIERLFAVELAVGAKQQRELWVGRIGISGTGGASGDVRELARLPLGPQGPDEEYAAGAELGPRGLLRWQSRGDISRCDGAPLRLFAERWDPAARRWQPAPASELPARSDGAMAVTAIRPVSGQPGSPPSAASPPSHPSHPSHPARTTLFAVRAPTSQRGAARADELGPAAELTDEDAKTAWRPGPAGSETPAGSERPQPREPRDGRGEVVSFRSRLGKASKATRLRIVPGDASSTAALRASSRPAKLWVIGPKQAFTATVPDPVAQSGGAYELTLPQPIEECLSVMIESVYPGTGTGTGADRSLAISELTVETDLEQKPDSAPALAELVRKGDVRAERMMVQLPEAQVVRALLALLGKSTDVAEKRRLLRVLAQLSEKEISEPLAAALREGWIAEAEVPEALSALSRIGDEAAMVELVVAPGAPPATKLEAARRMAARGSERLLELAGLGATEIRAEVIDGLSRLPQERLLAAAAQHGDSAAAMGDLWRAAVRRLFPPWQRGELSASDGVARAQLAAALAAQWPAAKEYERRYRLATSLAELAARGEPQLLPDVMAQLAKVPDPEGAALRQAVASQVARLARPELVSALDGFLRDRDAGVRLAAVRGLAFSDQHELAAVDGGLAGVLAADRWPELRRAAAGALGHRCQRPAPAAALEKSVAGDADVDVRQDALVALVTCAAPGIADRLVRTWDSGKAPLPLRERAVSLAVMLGDGKLSAPLIRSLARWRSEAFSDGDSLRLAVAAAGALGRLGGPDAAAALLAALDDGAYPELVAAAAGGLGSLGPACPASARSKLVPLTRSEERQISLAAKRAVARCGAVAPRRGASGDAEP